jgi:hypothetical protein
MEASLKQLSVLIVTKHGGFARGTWHAMVPLVALPKPQIGQINFQTPKTRFEAIFWSKSGSSTFFGIKIDLIFRHPFVTFVFDMLRFRRPFYLTLTRACHPFWGPRNTLKWPKWVFFRFFEKWTILGVFSSFFLSFFDPLFLTHFLPLSVSSEIVPFQGTISSQIHMSF